MRVAISYALISLIVAAAAVGVYWAGPVNNAATVVLGFVASIFAGAGLLAIYPALMSQEVAAQREHAQNQG